MSNERRTIRKIINDFLKRLDLKAKYTVSFTKYEAWSIKFREFDGSIGQRFLLETHLAMKLMDEKAHNAVVHWNISEKGE